VLNETLRATAIGGRVVNIGRYAGTRGEIDLEALALRRISLIGVTFRTRSLEEHAGIVAKFVAQHAGDLEAARLRPAIDRVMAFDELPAAIERAASGQQFGKLVLVKQWSGRQVTRASWSRYRPRASSATISRAGRRRSSMPAPWPPGRLTSSWRSAASAAATKSSISTHW